MRVSDQALCAIDKDARIAELEAALVARDTLIETLRFQLAQLKRMAFGQSSEKLSLQIEQLELTLEELEGEAEIADNRKAGAAKINRASAVRVFCASASCRTPDRAGHGELCLSRLWRHHAFARRR